MVRQSLASSDFRANCLPSVPPPMSPEYSDNREPLYVMNIIPMLNSDLPQFSVMFSCRAHLVSCREHCTVCITLGIAVTENEEMTQHHFLTFTEVLSLSLFILFIFPTASTYMPWPDTLGSVCQAISSLQVSVPICGAPIITFTRTFYLSFR